MKKSYDVRKVKGIDPRVLEVIDYEHRGKKIEVEITSDEFTCICPWSGLPDFANVLIRYVPADKCVELKSLKYYLQSYRNVGIVHESVVNRIMEDLVKTCRPVEMRVEAVFKVRGGLVTKVSASYKASD